MRRAQTYHANWWLRVFSRTGKLNDNYGKWITRTRPLIDFSRQERACMLRSEIRLQMGRAEKVKCIKLS